MTPDYPHIQKSLDTITPISADLGRVGQRGVIAREQGDLDELSPRNLVG